jgi:hypothetical protein
VRKLLPLAFIALTACPSPPAPPVTGTPGGIRYIIGGDSRDDASHVLPWAFREAKARGASAFFFLGDMALTPSADGHFDKELPLLDPIPFYPALGNHEIRMFGFIVLGHQQAEKAFRRRFLDTPRTPVASSIEGKIVYSVNLPGGVHFIALDNVSQNGFGADQLTWLGRDLDTANADAGIKYIIVGMHKPLAKNGVSTHGMDKDGAQALADSDAALALFVSHHVSLIVASHVHEFATLTQGGIPSYITGGLGAPLDRSGPEHAFHHFLQLDVANDGLHVSVVRFDGTPSMGEDEMSD